MFKNPKNDQSYLRNGTYDSFETDPSEKEGPPDCTQ